MLPQSKNSNLLTTAIIKTITLHHIGLLRCFTKAAAKGIFVLKQHFWHQDIPHIKTYPASSQLWQAVRH